LASTFLCCTIQVASLAIASANGLLMKGGREASETNKVLMSIVEEALGNYGCADAIAMVSTREAIADLLKMDQYIDLVIPRGSSELVASIKQQSKMIPVLGHAEGVCHVYVDKRANVDDAINIVMDSKTDYPAACNAMETLLVHEECMKNGVFDLLVKKLKGAGVKLYSGPNLSSSLAFSPELAANMKHEVSEGSTPPNSFEGVNPVEVIFQRN
jgi:delta-1-pyrroline-5-carboxylate synthetase